MNLLTVNSDCNIRDRTEIVNLHWPWPHSPYQKISFNCVKFLVRGGVVHITLLYVVLMNHLEAETAADVWVAVVVWKFSLSPVERQPLRERHSHNIQAGQSCYYI